MSTTFVDSTSTFWHLVQLPSTRIRYQKMHPSRSFADASHTEKGSQLSYIVGLVLGDVTRGSEFFFLSWALQISQQPVRSIPAAQILAAGDSIDEIVIYERTLNLTLGICIKLIVLVDSNDLYHSLSAQRNSIDKSFCADVNDIRLHYEISIDVFVGSVGTVTLLMLRQNATVQLQKRKLLHLQPALYTSIYHP